MNDAGFIDPNSEWSVTVGENGSVEVNRLDLKAENAKLRELVCDMLHWMPCQRPCQRCERYRYPEGCEFEIRRRKLGIEVD